MTALNPAFTVGSDLAGVRVRHRGASRVDALDAVVSRIRARENAQVAARYAISATPSSAISPLSQMPTDVW